MRRAAFFLASLNLNDMKSSLCRPANSSTDVETSQHLLSSSELFKSKLLLVLSPSSLFLRQRRPTHSHPPVNVELRATAFASQPSSPKYSSRKNRSFTDLHAVVHAQRRASTSAADSTSFKFSSFLGHMLCAHLGLDDSKRLRESDRIGVKELIEGRKEGKHLGCTVGW